MERTQLHLHVGNVYKGTRHQRRGLHPGRLHRRRSRTQRLPSTSPTSCPPTSAVRTRTSSNPSAEKWPAATARPFQRCLKRGDEIIVQIIKEGIGTKGPTLSTYVSIPGRILVMMPGMAKLGVSRKIEDEEERKRLRQILDGLKPPKDCGFIIRTAGVGRSKADIERDLKYLTRLFETIDKKAKSSAGPLELYAEGDLVTRTVRDVMTSDVERIVVDNEDVARKIKEFFKLVAPRTKNPAVSVATIPLHFDHSQALLLRRGGRQIIGRVHREEAVRLQQKPDVRRRHYRVILRPRDVRVPERVPQHHVPVLDGAVLLGPLDEPVAALRLVRVITRRVFLVLVERRDPDVVVHEPGPLPPPRIARGHRERVVHRERT